MTTKIPDPIENNVERLLVRNTVTGFEQGIAAVIGFLTCGPIGSLASWGTIRGLQGKWTPWFIVGVPSFIVINIVNIGIIFIMFGGDSKQGPKQIVESIVPDLVTPSLSPSPSPRSLPSYNSSSLGGSTLVQKCEQLKRSMKNNDFLEIASISFSIGVEHDTPLNTSVDEDCESVGINTSS